MSYCCDFRHNQVLIVILEHINITTIIYYINNAMIQFDRTYFLTTIQFFLTTIQFFLGTNQFFHHMVCRS